MLILRPSPEARHIGRMIYLIAAITIGLESFGITLETTDSFPVKFPEGFPVAGVAALILGFLGISLLARTVDDVADFLHARAVALHDASLLEDISKEDLAKYSPDLENRLRASLIDKAPRLRTIVGYLTFGIDVALPILISIVVVVMSASSIGQLLCRFSVS